MARGRTRGSTNLEWDEDMDYLLKGMAARGMSDTAMASALSVFLGYEVGTFAVRYRRKRLYGARPPRGNSGANFRRPTHA
jgi:hypothetical protein